MDTNVGILGVAVFLPPAVRSNDWWPSEVVAGWRDVARPPLPAGPLSPGAARVVDGLARQAADPFQGAVSRHVMDAGVTVLDMAELAGRDAIARAGIAADQIDLVLSHTVMPDLLIGNEATQIHHRLGLARRCIALETSASTYSFLVQLAIAEAMIAAGRVRHALLVQSCGASRLVDRDDPISPLFGDGATAVVVGRVSAGRGLLGAAHFCDGRYPDTLVAGVRGGAWSDAGRGVIHVADAVQMRDLLLQTADILKDSIDATLAAAGCTGRDVAFFAMHQGTPWICPVVQAHAGLQHARTVDTFTHTGYLFAAIVPAGLALADQAGLLAPGDLILLTAGGTGMAFGSMLLRWGP